MTNIQRPPHFIPTREDILSFLRKASGPISTTALANTLAVTEPELDGFTKRLSAMQRDGQLAFNEQGEIELAHSSAFVIGRASGHRDGFGFVFRDDGQEDIFLSEREMQKVMHNDRVRVRLVGHDKRGRPEGQIVEIVERANPLVIGRLLNENGVLLVAPEDKRICHDILINPKTQGKAKIGQVVSVEILHFPDRYTQAVGRIVEVLGEIDDPGMEIEIAVRKFNVPYQFSKPCLSEAQALPDSVTERDLVGRVDLRDIPLLTIDGEDARDFDDAVYCEPITQSARRGAAKFKGWRLLVAIADVSHYVRPGHPLDMDALERATSVYFPRRVIPMLPEKISNGLCSLNPHLDRLCMVSDMVISDTGDIQAYQFYPAVMHSTARLTYTEVWEALSNTRGPEAHKRATLMPHLQNLYDVYHALLKARQKRGAIDFDTVESEIICNAQGKIEQILPRHRNEAHKLIEECMLAANVCAADLLLRHHHLVLYRVHGGPTAEKLENLRAFLRSVGLSLGGGNQPQAADYGQLIATIKGRPDQQLLQTMVLRSFQQAVYAPENIGHFGLAYPAYTHFTSPIRRYPDLLVHRAIKAVLEHKKYHPVLPEQVTLNTALAPRARKLQAENLRAEEAKKKTAQKNGQQNLEHSPKQNAEYAIWAQLGLHSSANERRADEASRDVESWLKCYFMRDKLGGEYVGTVTSVTSFGLFVQLETLYVEGLVHVTELGSDYFEYDEIRNELRGQRTGIRYRLTDRIHVQVSRVDLDARRIDFSLMPSPSANRPSGRNTLPEGASSVTTKKGATKKNPASATTKNRSKPTDKAAKKSVKQASNKKEKKAILVMDKVKPLKTTKRKKSNAK